MTDEIIKLREQLVSLSKNPVETRKLLDQLTEEEIDHANIESPFHVGKKDIEATKDLQIGKIHKVHNGYVLSYHGGYRIFVDNKLLSTSNALQEIMDGVPANVTDQEKRESIELVLSAAEEIFRIPMYVFAHPITMFNIATMAAMYQNMVQNMSEVPTAETDNPEYDKFLAQMSELMDNFAKGLEKEGKEHERRMGYGERKNNESQGEKQTKGKTKKKREK